MIYLFTAENCSKCAVLKKQLKEKGTPYTERSADRLKSPEDEIDREALIEGSMGNMELPIMIDYDNNIHGC